MTNPKTQRLLDLLCNSVLGCVDETTTLQLSGGLDSAVVQAIARLPFVYTCTWPEFDSLEAARKVACHADIHPVTFTREEMIEVAVPEVARITRGRGTWTQCCQWFMHREMAKAGFKVSLNGEGSDELFGGYARYRVLYWLDKLLADPHLEEYGGFVQSLGINLDRTKLLNRMLARYGSSVGDAGESMTQTAGAHDEGAPLHELLSFEHDVAAAHGIEHRWPYMHAEIVEFAHGLAEEDKITAFESKTILRDVARALGVHPDCINEQTKRGLVVPPTWAPAGVAKWSRGWFEQLMVDAWLREQMVSGRADPLDPDNILCGARA